MTVIASDQVWILWAIISAGVAFGIYLEQTYRWAAKMSGPVVLLVTAMILTTLRLTPDSSPVYDFVDDYLVPAAIPLLLIRANVMKIIRESGSVFIAFHIAALGTVVGAFVAALLFRGAFQNVPEVTGIMTGSYIGGGVNFMAVKSAYNVDSALANPLIVADNFIMAAMFAVLLALSGSRWVLRMFPHAHTTATKAGDAQGASLAAQHWKRKEISFLDFAVVLAVTFVISAVAIGLTTIIKANTDSKMVHTVFANAFVLITLLTVMVATVFHRRVESLRGAEELGAYFLYVFLFVIGLRANLWEVIRNIPVLFLFCSVMALTNLAVTLALGRLLKLNIEELLLSVNATLGGAPSAAAMAISKGWSGLILPGLLVGIWGYVIGTITGIAMAEMLRAWMQ